jgi:hypothetical protein
MRKNVLAIVGLVLLCLLGALGTASGSPGTVTVDSTTDVNDGTTSSISALIADPGTDGVISLREAIEATNNDAGTDTIEFDIPVSDAGYQVSGITGTWTISLTSSLPTLTDGGTIISGTTQAANQGDLNPDGPEIEISGATLSFTHCLVIESADNVVHGLVINQCPLAGVLIQTSGADYNTVSGSYLGTDASGSSGLGNKQGVVINFGPQGNVVGGDTPEERNVISGNDQYGVYVMGDSADRNIVSGNYIGTDATGTQALGNGETGVAVSYGSQNNTIGGDTEGERNIISGNDGDGVSISEDDTTNNTVSGNYIGTAVSGAQALGNDGDGVQVSAGAQNNTVGGDTEGERNVISGNRNGVYIVSTDTMSNTVSGNYIGTDVAGSSDLGNTLTGVRIATGAQNNTIGGQTTGERNVISGNNLYGVEISGSAADGNRVSGNYIGTDAGGTQEVGNLYDGVKIGEGAENNTIGGQTAAERNIIAASTWNGVYINGSGTNGNTISHNYVGTDVTGTLDKGNTYDGVRIDGGAQDNTVGPNNLIAYNDRRGVYVDGTGTTGNTITENSIHSNGGSSYLGIKLGTGGNNDIPAPTDASVDGCFSVSGKAGAGDIVEVFTGPDEEGKTYLATDSADGTGDWEVAGPFQLDTYVTATATDASGNTSEFSTQVAADCYPVFLPLGMKRY